MIFKIIMYFRGISGAFHPGRVPSSESASACNIRAGAGLPADLQLFYIEDIFMLSSPRLSWQSVLLSIASCVLGTGRMSCRCSMPCSDEESAGSALSLRLPV